MLKESFQSKEAENDELKIELEIAQEKFCKFEERNKSMMESIMKLQDIVIISFLKGLNATYLGSCRRAIRPLPCETSHLLT